MRLRTFYEIAVLLPLVGAGIVAAVSQGEAELAVGLGPGGRERWLYPDSATRGAIAYGIVALWLLRELRRRQPARYAPLLWQAPLATVAANILLLAPLPLIHGHAGEFLAEHGGRVGLRLLARLAIGFGYVGLLVFVRERLRGSGAIETDDQAARSAAEIGG